MKLWFLILFFCCSQIAAQKDGFVLPEQVKKETIPFQFINNLIFIPVTLNGVQLTFLLDTGVSETLLFSLENKEVNFNDVEKMTFSGLGENIDVQGLKSINNKVIAGKQFTDDRHTVYIILNEDFNFSSHVGIPVNGILGYYFFKNHPVEIDYASRKITVYGDQKDVQRKARKYSPFPITLEYNKPYVMANVQMNGEKENSKLLVDLGNSDAVWLFPSLIKDFVYNRPNIEDFLGRGFNGDIYGKRSRIKNFFMGDFRFEKPVTAMPDEYSIQNVNMAKDRKGSVGSEIMKRFSVLFDYQNKKMYLKKNRFFSDPFLFNMSGLDFMHEGSVWVNEFVQVENPVNNTEKKDDIPVVSNAFQYKMVMKPIFAVAGVRKDSPAFKAGIKKGDVLVSVNGTENTKLTLQKLNDLMSHDEGKMYNFTVKRKGETLNFSFTLEDPIPYQE